jgi:hypothetical protein
MVSTRWLSKPGFTDCSASRLRSIRPAPTSSTIDTATWPTTSAARIRPEPVPLTAAPPSLSAETRFVRPGSAGNTANTRPVSTQTARVKVSTWPSSAISAARGVKRAANPIRSSMVAAAKASPSSPPAIARTPPSVSIWRKSRIRSAPSAARRAISRDRRVSRARVRLAMLAHAMRRTNAVVPISSRSVGRASRVSSSRSDAAAMVKPWPPG